MPHSSGRSAPFSAFRNDAAREDRAPIWRRRHRLATAMSALAWGLAPVLFLRGDDLAYSALLTLVLLGVAVGGMVAVATDRTAIVLWLVPIAVPLPIVLLGHGDDDTSRWRSCR